MSSPQTEANESQEVAFLVNDLRVELEKDSPALKRFIALFERDGIPPTHRARIWEVLLGVGSRSAEELSGLESRAIVDDKTIGRLRSDCERVFSNEHSAHEAENVISFCCLRNEDEWQRYSPLLPVLLQPVLSLFKEQTERCAAVFEKVVDVLVPSVRYPKPHLSEMLVRLLLRYHDPLLSLQLDQRKIALTEFLANTISSLFVNSCGSVLLPRVWDFLLIDTSVDRKYFLALAILVLNKRSLLESSDENFVSTLRIATPAVLEELQMIARGFASTTPRSFRDWLRRAERDPIPDVGGEKGEHRRDLAILQRSLCLPVRVEEVVQQMSIDSKDSTGITFFLIDCRSEKEFNAGHLPTAFHFDATVVLEAPLKFLSRIQELAAIRNDHIVLCGDGFKGESDQTLNLIAVQLLQQGYRYVGLVDGGFRAIHRLYVHRGADIVEHNANLCDVCVRKRKDSPDKPVASHGFFSVFTDMGDRLEKIRVDASEYVASAFAPTPDPPASASVAQKKLAETPGRRIPSSPPPAFEAAPTPAKPKAILEASDAGKLAKALAQEGPAAACFTIDEEDDDELGVDVARPQPTATEPEGVLAPTPTSPPPPPSPSPSSPPPEPRRDSTSSSSSDELPTPPQKDAGLSAQVEAYEMAKKSLVGATAAFDAWRSSAASFLRRGVFGIQQRIQGPSKEDGVFYIHIRDWIGDPSKKFFPAILLTDVEGEMISVFMVVTPNSIITLRAHPSNPSYAQQLALRQLDELVRITGKKSNQHIVIFHWQTEKGVVADSYWVGERACVDSVRKTIDIRQKFKVKKPGPKLWIGPSEREQMRRLEMEKKAREEREAAKQPATVVDVEKKAEKKVEKEERKGEEVEKVRRLEMEKKAREEREAAKQPATVVDVEKKAEKKVEKEERKGEEVEKLKEGQAIAEILPKDGEQAESPSVRVSGQEVGRQGGNVGEEVIGCAVVESLADDVDDDDEQIDPSDPFTI